MDYYDLSPLNPANQPDNYTMECQECGESTEAPEQVGVFVCCWYCAEHLKACHEQLGYLKYKYIKQETEMGIFSEKQINNMVAEIVQENIELMGIEDCEIAIEELELRLKEELSLVEAA